MVVYHSPGLLGLCQLERVAQGHSHRTFMKGKLRSREAEDFPEQGVLPGHGPHLTKLPYFAQCHFLPGRSSLDQRMVPDCSEISAQ